MKFSTQIEQLIEQKANKYRLPVNFVRAVVQIESSGNPNAIGDQGRSFGLMQVMRGGALSEYEKQKKRSVSDSEALNPEDNLEIGCWYLGERIPQYLEAYDKEKTIRNVVICYNAGIGNLIKGRVPAGTESYLAKVQKLTGLDLGASPVNQGAFFFNCPCCGKSLQVTALK